MTALVAVVVLMVAVGVAVGLGPHTARARGEEAAPENPGLPTPQQTKEFLESSGVDRLEQAPETDPQAAEELPHRELDGEEALELAEGVFGEVLEGPAGIYDELEPTRFLSEYAAVVPASSLPGSAEEEEEEAEEAGGQEAGGPQAEASGQSLLLESTLPLETEDAEGEVEPVDLTLQSSEGSGGGLQPQNPLAEVAIPAHLEEGITVGAVGIEVVGTEGERTPTNVEEQYAFYPNVAENTDLVVAPTATGVETMTDIRSAEAPRSTTYRLSLPEGASLEAAPGGGAEAVWGGEAFLVVPPPSATDAEGQEVPTEMEVDGNELKVTVDPDPSTAYPILVDPAYNTETWEWSENRNEFEGWTGSTNTASYGALTHLNGYTVAYKGLDLTSGYPGSANQGAEANWSYWVPRYRQEPGNPPTSWVEHLDLYGEWFLEHGNDESYPVLITGLVQPGVGWAGATPARAHYGGQGELNTWGNNFEFANSGGGEPNTAIKGADMDLFTNVPEAQAKWRDTFIGAATVVVGDNDNPKVLSLTPPSGWLTGTAAKSVGYHLEDTGLGVHSASVRLAGEEKAHAGWGGSFPCTGASASPCPRSPVSTESGRPAVTFVPGELPTGRDILEVTAADPLGHEGTGDVAVMVDNTAPEITLSGPLAEDGPPAPRGPLPHDPVAAWSFDEGKGTVVHDATGHGHEGTVEGAHWVTGRFGESLKFAEAGSSLQCVRVPDSSELQLSHEFTLEAWVRPEGHEGQDPIIFKELEPGSNYSYALGIGLSRTGHVEGFAQGSEGEETVYSPETVEEDEWTHVAYSYDGQTMRLFVDGEKVSEELVASEEFASSGALLIGCSSTDPEFDEQFKGRIDEVRVYDRALAEGEIADDETMALGPRSSTRLPVAAYPLDEGSGTVAHDATGHGHEGTVEGAQWTGGKFGESLKFAEAGSSLQCVRVPDSPELQLSQEFTLEAWVRPEGYEGQDPIIFKELEPGSEYSYALGIGVTRAGRLEGWGQSSEGTEDVYSPDTLAEGEWTHVAYAYDGGHMRLYVDGRQVADEFVGRGEFASSGPLLIGCSSTNPEFDEQFKGRIDEVKIYDRALDEGEIDADESAGAPVSQDSLEISATDGSEDDPPQSGVSSVEVKVDGKKAAMPDQTPCKERDCSYDGTWTLKPSEYTAGDHEVEVVATDAVGHRSVETLEVELGTAPPQTSFTSPHPSYEEHEVPSIGFKATKGGVPLAGATFRCSLDGNVPTTPCDSPYPLPHLDPKNWHTFRVVAVDGEGNADPTAATWKFKTGTYPSAPAGSGEKLVYPEAGKKTASYYTLEAQWGESPEGKASEGVTGVSFQTKLPKGSPGAQETFQPVPAECVVDGHGQQVSWPLPAKAHPGHSAPVYLRVRGCPVFEEAGYPEQEIQFRAVFDGGEKVAGASEPASTEFVSRYNADRVSTDATEAVGPATVDLLTGAFTLSRTDVSIPIPGYEANLEFTRTYSSTVDKDLPSSSMVLGGAWQPGSPLESEYEGEAWTRVAEKEIPSHPAVYGHYCWTEDAEVVGEEEGELIEELVEHEASCPPDVETDCPQVSCERWLEEEEQPRERWIELIDNEGAAVTFEISENDIISPEYARELSLSWEGGNVVLAYPNGTQTTFVPPEGSALPEGKRVWTPKYISYQANAQSLRMVYEPEPGGKNQRLVEEISPTPVGGTACAQGTSKTTPGCRTLLFEYYVGTSGTLCGVFQSLACPKMLEDIQYFGPSGAGAGKTVAYYNYTNVTGLEGKTELTLSRESDPRTNLAETYAYGASSFRMKSLTPPGQTPWEFSYLAPVDSSVGATAKLKSVSRGGSSTTLAYEVPVKGAGAPYDMSSENIAGWGESDLPVDATAIFPPNHVPSEYPPHEYTGATVHYMDPEGYEVNTASPSPPGVVGNTISTTETDVHGNVVRELDPQNRLIALASPDPPARSHELDTHSVWSPNGNEELESWSPLHLVRLASGETVNARRHTVTQYDKEEPTPPVGKPWAYLPTKETVSAVVPGRAEELEPRVTETRYKWELRKPIETIVDPGGLDIRSVTVYNSAGQVEETRQPKASAGGTAGATKTVYYSAGGSGECNNNAVYSNLPCKVLPAKQEAGSGRSELPVTRFLAYNTLGEPTEIVESPGGKASSERKTITTYDAAGRQLIEKFEGGGTAMPKTETVYSPTLGLPERQQQACESNCATYSTSFGGSGTGELKRSLGIAVDASGDVYVAARELNCVKKFSPASVFLGAIGKCGTEGSGNGEFKEPRAVAIDPSGHIWVVDTGNKRVEEFTAGGAYIQSLGGGHLSSPYELAVDGEGRVWVGDQAGKIVEYKETSPGVYPFTAEVASVEGATVEPDGLSVDASGDLWIAEGNADRITEFEKIPGGYAYHHIFGSAGNGAGQFTNPFDVAVGRWGELLVVDEGNDRIQQYSLRGNYMGSFGVEGAGAGQLIEPASIALGPGGAVYVTDRGNKRVDRWQASFGARATTTTYNALGQVTAYEDADGAETETRYDAYGRPVTMTDPKGTQTLRYDEASGLVTSMEVSGIGTFTAAYDADGDLLERGLPNGLTAKTTYNQAGEPMTLAYMKGSSAWYEESLERSIEGRILTGESSSVGEGSVSWLRDAYSYDKAGRLTEAQETPSGGQCTSRAYTYDADSNRLTKTTREPGIGEVCATTGGTPQKYEYDAADRLIGPTYDARGRITSLPAEFAGGKQALTTEYFANDMVAKQKQGLVTNTFQLDATGRQRQREQTGGVAGIEVFHYDGPGDSPSWTSLGATWSRNVAGIGGELAAVQESTGTTTFKLTDLHGDVVASASSSPIATGLLATYRFTEFGEPVSGSEGRFGWLGGKSRRTELPSGVIQMGARSYIPQLGRFLTPDPVRGGSANPYDYADQDPVNNFDIGGEKCANGQRPGHGKCAGPPTPKEVRRDNRRRAIAVHFRSRAAAQRFVHMMQGRPNFTETVARKAGEWKAKEIQKVQEIATRAAEIARWAGPPPSAGGSGGDSGACGFIAEGAGVVGFGVALAPETGGVSAIIGALSAITGAGDLTGSC